MRWLPSLLLLLFGTVICIDDDSNEVVIKSSIKPPINLDTNLRKALLKALIELEHDDAEQQNRNTDGDYVNIITHLDNKGKNVERAPASAISYTTTKQPVNMTITVKKTTSKPKHTVVIQKSKSSFQTQSNNDDLDVSETPEHYVASASSSFASKKVKSDKLNDKKTSSVNSLTERIIGNKLVYEKPTTVKPTTSTEESEANVESLQFFSAPLVAAFTVHQDEKGLPKKVVPIYKQTDTKQFKKEKKGQDVQVHNFMNQQELNNRHADELRQRQKKLEEEIRRLKKLQEEQERIIKEQRLTYEQKIFEQQQKLFTEQTRLFKNVQPFVPITTSKPSFQPTNQLSNFDSTRNGAGTLVSIQPSVGFIQPTFNNGILPLNAQILPVRNAIDFRTPFPQNFRQFRDQDNIIPNSLSTSLNTAVSLGSTSRNVPSPNTIQQPLINLRPNFPNVDFLQSLPAVPHNTLFRQSPSVTHTSTQSLPLTSISPSFRVTDVPRQQHGTRHLRQETGTGNFLNNNLSRQPSGISDFFTDHRFNRIPSSFVGVQRPTEFPKPISFGGPNNPINTGQYNTLQYSVDEPLLNQRLNNLLYHSGLSQGRQQEDLNIVSKVLSLNHLGSGSTQFPSSNLHNPLIRPPNNWGVQ